MCEHKKTLGISYALEAGAPFSVVDTIYCNNLYSLTVKKLSFGINFCSYLIGFFQNFLEQILPVF